MDQTISLLKTIGYPEHDGTFDSVNPVESKSLLRNAEQNKISTLYLERLREQEGLTTLSEEAEERRQYWTEFEATIARACGVLDNAGLDYCIVKTPVLFQSDFGDVDILLHEEDLSSAETEFEDAGFRYDAQSPSSFDYVDPETKQIIDIQNNFTLREVIYLPGRYIFENTEPVERAGTIIKVPNPGAEISLLVVHAVSEQLFVLRDFYYILALFERMDWAGYTTFNSIVYESGLEGAMATVLPLVKGLSRIAFDRCPDQLEAATSQFKNYGEFNRLQASSFSTPHRYTATNLLKCLYHKISDPRFRWSLFQQATEFKDPEQTMSNIKTLLKRQRKQTY